MDTPEPVLIDGYVGNGDESGPSARQTYDAFVCDSQDTLHLVTRQWRRGADEPFPGRTYGALIHQSRPAGGTWSAPTVIVVPPAPGYAIFYHKLALDHRDRLFLSCSYVGGAELVADHALTAGMAVLGRAQPGYGKYRRRMLLVSDDGGSAWRFATNEDLSGEAGAAGTARAPAPTTAQHGDELPPGLRWLSPTPQGNQLTAIDLVGGAEGWAVGTHGTIMKTTDGGLTWSSQFAPTEAHLFGLAAVDRTTAWAVGEGGVILHTVDGGATWRQQVSGTTEGLFAVSGALGAPRLGGGDAGPRPALHQRRPELAAPTDTHARQPVRRHVHRSAARLARRQLRRHPGHARRRKEMARAALVDHRPPPRRRLPRSPSRPRRRRRRARAAHRRRRTDLAQGDLGRELAAQRGAHGLGHGGVDHRRPRRRAR